MQQACGVSATQASKTAQSDPYIHPFGYILTFKRTFKVNRAARLDHELRVRVAFADHAGGGAVVEIRVLADRDASA